MNRELASRGQTKHSLHIFGCILCTSLAAVFLFSLMSLSQAQAGPLHDAAKSGDIEAVKLALAAGEDIDESDFVTGAALHIAVLGNHTAAVDVLLENGADIEAESELNSSRPLHMAAGFGKTEILASLISGGADIEAYDGKGRTALILAAIAGHTSTVEALLVSGARPGTIEAYNGTNALHHAAFNGRVFVIELLLEHGAAVDSLDNNGQTPLHWAVSNGQTEVIKLLAARGADVNRRDHADHSAIWIARYAANPEDLVALLRELGAKD